MPAEHCQAAARAEAVKHGVKKKKTKRTGKVEYGTVETRAFVFFQVLLVSKAQAALQEGSPRTKQGAEACAGT